MRKGQGRKPKLNNRDLRSLRRHCIKNPHSSISDITHGLRLLWHTFVKYHNTLGYIHKCQLKLYCAKRKPYVNSVQKRRRLLWARRHLGWTITQWNVYCGQMNQYSGIFGRRNGRRVLRNQRRKRIIQTVTRQTSPKARVCHGMGLCQCPWQR